MDIDMDVRARIPADIEAPDRIFYQLTARQVAVLTASGGLCYLFFSATRRSMPLPAVLAIIVVVLGVAAAVALTRRDGLPMDAWLWAAIRFRRTPRRTVPASDGIPPLPGWAPTPTARVRPPSVLRLPVTAIGDSGVIEVEPGHATVLVAASTVNVGLRTGAEQAALAGGYGRWLNSLTGPVQIVVSARRVDLAGHAERIAAGAAGMTQPALAGAAADYADFLYEISENRDPLSRSVTLACTAAGPRAAGLEALRRAEHTAAALASLGCRTRVLDGQTATAVLTAATDPFQPTDASWPRALPQQAVTAAGGWEAS